MENNILMESDTDELRIVEFYLDEPAVSVDENLSTYTKVIEEDGKEPVYRSYYGINVNKVIEIIKLPKVTPLPEVRDQSILGAFNLRSQIIPLIDLSTWLGKQVANHDDHKVVVTEFNNTINGFMVSGLNRIHRLTWSDVDPPSSYLSAFSNSCISGVVRLEGRIVFILDLEKIVTGLNPSLALHLDEDFEAESDEVQKILVADDSNIVRDILQKLLEKAWFEVELATNGQEAWDKLLAYKKLAHDNNCSISEYVKAVITDIEMPAMDGTTLCKNIKEDMVLQELPVVLFSSLVTEKLMHKGHSVGADEQVNKPDVTTLAQKTHELINNTKYSIKNQ